MNALTYVLYTPLGGLPYTLTFSGLVTGLAFGTTSAIFEEFGWRGFAQPALEKRFNPLVAGLLVGLMWGVWHLRLNVTMAAAGEPWYLHLLSPWGILGMPAFSVLMAWIHSRARQSLLLMFLFHFSLTSSFFFFGVPAAYPPAEELRFYLTNLTLAWLAACLVAALAALQTRRIELSRQVKT